jgi:gas vesicle protein
MDHHDDHLAMLAIAFLGGALAGTVAALLLAPAAGRVTRARLKD